MKEGMPSRPVAGKVFWIALATIVLALSLPFSANIWSPPPPIYVEPGWGVDDACLQACYREFRDHWKRCCSVCLTCMQIEWLDYEACVGACICEC